MSDKYRFEEIIGEIKELLEEAIDLVPEGSARDRAKLYWYAHISVALDHDHDYMSRSMCCMKDTFEEIEEEDSSPSHPQFNCQQDWDDYVARNGINQYEDPIDDEDWDHDAGRPASMRDEDWD